MKLIKHSIGSLCLSIFICFQLSAQVNLSSGLVSYYPLDSLSFTDSIGNNDFPPNSGPQNLFPRNDRNNDPAKAIYMNTSAERSLSSSTWPSGNSSRSFSLWYRTNSLPQSGQAGYDFLFFQGSQFNSTGIGMAIGRNSVIFIGYLDDLVASAQTTTSQWDHLVGTYDGDTAKLYHNGALVGQQAKNWNTIGTNVNLGYFTQSGSTHNNDFSGALDDIRVYNRVLNAQEVSALYNGQVTAIRNAKLQKQQLVVYPNPVSETLYVKNINPNKQTENVQLFDLNGRIVRTIALNDLKNGINVSDLDHGVYWLKVGVQQVEKVIVK